MKGAPLSAPKRAQHPEVKSKTMLLSIEGKRAFFFHLPKAGGRIIYRAFNCQPQPHTRLLDTERQKELALSDYAFSFVRHPLDRAVSFFHWVRGIHLDPKQGRRGEHIGLNIFSRHEEVNAFYRKFDFTYWEKVSYMLRPQSWMMHNPQMRVDPRINLYLFEAFDAEFKRLCAALEVPAKKAPTLKGIPKSPEENKWEDILADDVIEKLCDYYASDFEAFPFYENPMG